MRWMVLAALAVAAGCAAQSPPRPAVTPPSPLTTPDPRYIPPHTPEELRRRIATENAAARDMMAAELCNARAEMAGATYAGRGFGLAGAIGAGMEAGIAAERVRHACLTAYRATGVLPSY